MPLSWGEYDRSWTWNHKRRGSLECDRLFIAVKGKLVTLSTPLRWCSLFGVYSSFQLDQSYVWGCGLIPWESVSRSSQIALWDKFDSRWLQQQRLDHGEAKKLKVDTNTNLHSNHVTGKVIWGFTLITTLLILSKVDYKRYMVGQYMALKPWSIATTLRTTFHMNALYGLPRQACNAITDHSQGTTCSAEDKEAYCIKLKQRPI